MRLYIRYTILIISLSYLVLRLITHSTSIQRQTEHADHSYFQSRLGEPLQADEQTIAFYPDKDLIVYNAAWNRRVMYTVHCELSNRMELFCESVVHYGMAQVPATERYVFLWDE